MSKATTPPSSELTTRLRALTAELQRLSDLVRRSEPPTMAEPDPVAERVYALVQAQRMVPLAELPQLASATKSVAWQKVHDLERQGRVWLRKTHSPNGAHPRIEVYAADAVVTESRRVPASALAPALADAAARRLADPSEPAPPSRPALPPPPRVPGG